MIHGVDSKVIQVEEALSASSHDRYKAISMPQRQTRASSPARDPHGVMCRTRVTTHVPSREVSGESRPQTVQMSSGQRSTSSFYLGKTVNALCKGFETIMT